MPALQNRSHTMMGAQTVPLYILLGLAAGVLSGLVGIGGGVLIVPALVFLFGFTQHQAQGTTLALLVPPIGLLAAWAYYKEGYVNIPAALLVCIGFVAGSYLGARLATGIPDAVLGRIFGGFLILVGLKMILMR
ncbi:MAG TPA: sulfite exporter TauE/SafE family protein [Bacteroidota bacterium]|nr:sulfite exporter TauE/SafE family protein [Bacteroidota bacterium]